MFSKKEKQEKQENNLEEEAKKALQERVAKEFVVHTMPAKFRSEKHKAKQSKTVGVLIIGGGVILMLAVVVVLYYFLFAVRPTAEVLEPEEANNIQILEEENPPEESSTTEENKESTEEIATSTEIEAVATSTNEDLEEVGMVTSTEETEISQGEMSDTDGDGLTDKEEYLLGTDINNIDTDGDGFDDLSEVLNLYDPLSAGNITANPNISSADGDHGIIYPTNWSRSAVDDQGSIIFNSSDNHFIQIVAQENTDFESIDDWYEKLFSPEEVKEENKLTFADWDGVKSDDGFYVYLTDKERNYIFSLSYTPISEDEPVYKNIFAMMLKSFVEQ